MEICKRIAHMMKGIVDLFKAVFSLHISFLMYTSLFPDFAITEHRHLYFLWANFLYFTQSINFVRNFHQGFTILLSTTFAGLFLLTSVHLMRNILRPHATIRVKENENGVVTQRDVFIQYKPFIVLPTCSKSQKVFMEEFILWVFNFCYNFKVIFVIVDAAVLCLCSSNVLYVWNFGISCGILLGEDGISAFFYRVFILMIIMLLLSALLAGGFLFFGVQLSHYFDTFYHVNMKEIDGRFVISENTPLSSLSWPWRFMLILLGLPFRRSQHNICPECCQVHVNLRCIVDEDEDDQDVYEKVPITGVIHIPRQIQGQYPPNKLLITLTGGPFRGQIWYAYGGALSSNVQQQFLNLDPMPSDSSLGSMASIPIDDIDDIDSSSVDNHYQMPDGEQNIEQDIDIDMYGSQQSISLDSSIEDSDSDSSCVSR